MAFTGPSTRTSQRAEDKASPKGTDGSPSPSTLFLPTEGYNFAMADQLFNGWQNVTVPLFDPSGLAVPLCTTSGLPFDEFGNPVEETTATSPHHGQSPGPGLPLDAPNQEHSGAEPDPRQQELLTLSELFIAIDDLNDLINSSTELGDTPLTSTKQQANDPTKPATMSSVAAEAGSFFGGQEKVFLQPLRLEKWDNYFDEQAVILTPVWGMLFPSERLYERIKAPPGAKWTAQQIHQTIVEIPLHMIIERIKDRIPFGAGLEVKRHVNWLAETGREVFMRRSDNTLIPDVKPERPNDQDLRSVFRLSKQGNGGNPNHPGDLLYFFDMHQLEKMPMHDLRLGLKTMELGLKADKIEKRSLDEVFLNYVGKTQHIIQTINRMYHYMLEAGLSFGYITNGPAFVFLRINWHNPTILQYQLMEPMEMAKHHEGQRIQCSAAMQVLSFAILSLTKTQAEQDDRQKIITQMKDNPPLVQELFRHRDIFYDDHVHTAAMAPFQEPITYPNVDMDHFHRRDVLIHAERTGYGTHVPRIHFPKREEPPRLDQWCTVWCLLGLKLGHFMDPTCPNVAAHVGNAVEEGEAVYTHPHPISYAEFVNDITNQFKHTLDVGLIPLNKQGKRGIYFQCIFLQRGYVFLAKGTAAEFQIDFHGEQMAHFQVQDLEAECIPVHMGLFNFSIPIISRPYYADHKTYLYHFALFSFCGYPVSTVPRPKTPFKFKEVETIFGRILTLFQDRNLSHGNITPKKLLWDVYRNRFTLANLTHALLGKKPTEYLTLDELLADVHMGVPFVEADRHPPGVRSLDWNMLDLALKQSHREGDVLIGCGLVAPDPEGLRQAEEQAEEPAEEEQAEEDIEEPTEEAKQAMRGLH